MRVLPWLFVLAGAILALGAWAGFGQPRAQAAGPCGTPHDALDAEEQQFIQLIQVWRDQNLQYSTQLQVSGALNAAAAWFAQWQVDNNAPGGHTDGLGRSWPQRALDCGYTGTTSTGTPYAYGSGEGIRAYASSSPIIVTASQAAAQMVYPGSGIYAQTPSTSLPFKCVGAAHAASSDGRRVAWVVVIAQYPATANCPGSSASAPTATPSASPTASPTATPTRTPTPTPQPTPLPRPDGATVTLWSGWNLVVVPAGPVTSVLARAQGCYTAVYQYSNGAWQRYVPGAPAYVNSLQTLNGGAVWVAGTAANCGTIQL